MTPTRDRMLALAASFAITGLALPWLMTRKPVQRTIAADSRALQVHWIPRAQATPAVEHTALEATQPVGRKRIQTRGAHIGSRTAAPTSSVPAPTLDLRVPETAAVSFAPHPLRPPPASLAVDHLPRFVVRDGSSGGRSRARDCAELRAALRKGANAEVILRSMRARGCAD